MMLLNNHQKYPNIPLVNSSFLMYTHFWMACSVMQTACVIYRKALPVEWDSLKKLHMNWRSPGRMASYVVIHTLHTILENLFLCRHCPFWMRPKLFWRIWKQGSLHLKLQIQKSGLESANLRKPVYFVSQERCVNVFWLFICNVISIVVSVIIIISSSIPIIEILCITLSFCGMFEK